MNVDLAIMRINKPNFALNVIAIVKNAMDLMLKIVPNVQLQVLSTTFTSKCVSILVRMDTMPMRLPEFVKFVRLVCSVQHAKLTSMEMFNAKHAVMDTICKLIKPAQQDVINTTLKMNGTIAVMPAIRTVETVQVLTNLPV